MKNSNTNRNEISWDKVFHWYGRATNYPEYFNEIRKGGKQQQEAITKIKNSIEHQGGIICATPIALPFILDLLYEATSTTQQGLLEVIEKVMSSVIFQYEWMKLKSFHIKMKVEDLLTEEYLFPSFIDDESDEILWENSVAYNPEAWLAVTSNLLIENRDRLAALKTFNKVSQEIKEKILKETAQLKEIWDKIEVIGFNNE